MAEEYTKRERARRVYSTALINKLIDDIYGMIAFDMFTGQRDRGEHNFMFECDSDDGTNLGYGLEFRWRR